MTGKPFYWLSPEILYGGGRPALHITSRYLKYYISKSNENIENFNLYHIFVSKDNLQYPTGTEDGSAW